MASEILLAGLAVMAAGTGTSQPCPASGLGPVPPTFERALSSGLARLGPEGFVAAPAPQARYLVLAYGARWCAPCQVFTRQVAPFLRAGDEARFDYAYVFVSRDHNRSEALRYARAENMSWLILPPDAAERRPAIAGLGARTPPDLVIVDRQTGTITCRAMQGRRYLGAWTTLARFRALVDSTRPPP